MSSFLDELKVFVAIFVLYAALDLPMITYFNNATYAEMYKKINGGDGPSGAMLWGSAVVSYLFLTLGIYYFGIRQNSIINVLVLGIYFFGAFHATNMATIKNWDVKVATIDSIWGISLMVLLAVLVPYIPYIGSGDSGNSMGGSILTTTDLE